MWVTWTRCQGTTDLFAVLVSDDVTLCGTRVCTEHDAILEETADDGRARAGCLW